MALPLTPMMTNKNQVPYVPTGYESLGADIQQKRAIAEAMMQRGLGPRENMRSPFELLGNLAQVWAGKSMQQDASDSQAALDWQRQQQAQQAQQKVVEALHGGATPQQIAEQFGSDPQMTNNPVVKAMLETYTKQMGNSAEVDGAPIQLDTGNGVKSFMRMKNGDLKPIEQGTVANEKKLFNDVVVDPMNVKAGTVFPDVSKTSYMGPDGKPVLNAPLVEAEKQKAAAGRTTVNTSTYVNAMDKSFGKVIPEAVTAELTSNRQAGMSYIQTRPELDRAEKALKGGVINGFGAGARLDLARAADALGVGGKTQKERIANTQIYIQNMGRQMLPILQALKPASDTDVKTAQMMSGGDISLSNGAMLSAIRAAKQSGHQAVQNTRSRVRELSATFGKDPDIAAGLKSFDIEESPGERAARILAERRARK